MVTIPRYQNVPRPTDMQLAWKEFISSTNIVIEKYLRMPPNMTYNDLIGCDVVVYQRDGFVNQYDVIFIKKVNDNSKICISSLDRVLYSPDQIYTHLTNYIMDSDYWVGGDQSFSWGSLRYTFYSLELDWAENNKHLDRIIFSTVDLYDRNQIDILIPKTNVLYQQPSLLITGDVEEKMNPNLNYLYIKK